MSMRVKGAPKVPVDAPRLAPTEEKHSTDNFGHQFQRRMTDMQTSDYEEYIKELTEKIYQQGEMLGKRVDVAEFQKYREMITQLFNEIASNSYAFCKTDRFDQRGRHKVIAVIRKVNQKLDEMAAMVLKNEAENIELLHAVDDIRGMLVDMFL